MKIWGVYKKELWEDMDTHEEDILIVCFEDEKDAKQYVAKHNHTHVFDGKEYDELFVQPVKLVRSGEYDDTNNYGFNANTCNGPAFRCSCGHATVVPFENLRTKTEELTENNVVIGLKITLPFVCERCGQHQLAAEEVQMFNSDDVNTRCQIAQQGYNLENYVYDESSRVRQIVARKGVGHDVFIANPNEHPAVLREIAEQGKYLDVLKNHPDKSVSKLANKKLLRMMENH